MSHYTPKKRISVAFLSVTMSLMIACKHDDQNRGEPDSDVIFEHQGLGGHEVVHLYEHKGRLLAATDKGLYEKTAADSWESTGLDDVKIFDVTFLDEQHFIASIRETQKDDTLNKLVQTLDGGETWEPIDSDFGGEATVDGPKAAYNLHYDDNNNALYATGTDALAVSYNEGISWNLLSGMWDAFSQPKHALNYNPATNDIWYGGQNAIEEMVLRRYSLDTEEETSFHDLMPNPSVIYGIEFDPENEQGVYASGEGGIVKTLDNGANWITLLGDVDHRFYFHIAIDPADPQTIYTGGWDKNRESPQPLILEISKDGGETWTEHRHPSDTLFGGVRSILATTENDRTVIYLGLYGGGIMEATLRE